jgi:RNase H-like domain found in reverse transcriptase/Reverse transcriptase (RNA-dependent DNA polymerase)/Integrase zinc binding domain/Chromo (CHRromatin Organisation MOdifier) domain/Retroviral aspartyl protease
VQKAIVKPFVISINIIHPITQVSIPTVALIDSGATACFVDKQWTIDHLLPTSSSKKKLAVSVVDGRDISSGPVVEELGPLPMIIEGRGENISFFVTKISFPIILGLSWLQARNPLVDWLNLRLFFHKRHASPIDQSTPTINNLTNAIDPSNLKLNSVDPHPNLSGSNSRINSIEKAIPLKNVARAKSALTRSDPITRPEHPIICELISALAMMELPATDVLFIGSIITSTTLGEPPTVSLDLTTVPEKYKQFLDVFSKGMAETLPEHRTYDCTIDLEPGSQPPFGPIYALTEPEAAALIAYLQEMLASGFINHSRSPAGAPVLFVKKKDGTFRICIDYRGLNNVTIKNRYPLPLISSLLDQLRSAKIYTKLDLRGAYNLVRIKKGEEWKTAFRTRYGHFEYNVMPFGLTNAPAVFQHFMNDIFREYLDRFMVVYLDDILIFSEDQESHDHHVQLVLTTLRQHQLFAKLEKCSFDTSYVEFLGYCISSEGVSMDSSKIKTVVDWASPSSVKEVQRFLGFANFYRRFIKNYSAVVSPLTNLTKKNIKFVWTPTCETAFSQLKKAFTSAPVLRHIDPNREFILETDASDFALGSVLSQYDDENVLHPVAFHSRKFTAPEINYEIYDKELLAIVNSFEIWRSYLVGAQHRIHVFTDHKNLRFFSTSRVLNRRQARWSMFLSDFSFIIEYRPGSTMGKPDALSRQTNFELKSNDPEVLGQFQALLKPDQLRLNNIQTWSLPADHDLFLEITSTLLSNDFSSAIIQQISNDSVLPRHLTKYSLQDKLLFYEDRIFVPEISTRTKILQLCHDANLAGHYGQGKTLELVSRQFWWPKLRQFVISFVESCIVCSRSKSSHHRPFGLLKPLPVPDRPWGSISMDFIVQLPLSDGFDAVLVVVDRLTKMSHFIPCTTTETAETTSKLIIKEIIRLHGIPDDITTDRGSIFMSVFWKSLFNLLGVKNNASSAFHPESDGQTERVNQVLEQYLRCFVSYQQTDWNSFLPMAEFTYNNTFQTTIRNTPFRANFGFDPRFSAISLPVPVNLNAETRVESLVQIQVDLKQFMSQAQLKYKEMADRFRIPGPDFLVGDSVWLNTRNISTTRPCKKLDYRKIGPFTIIEKINEVAFKLDLPTRFLIHPVFHISLLEKFIPSTLDGRNIDDDIMALEIEGSFEYEIEAIVDTFVRRNIRYFVVKWRGYSETETSPEPLSNLSNCLDVVEQFKLLNPHLFKRQSKSTKRKRKIPTTIANASDV